MSSVFYSKYVFLLYLFLFTPILAEAQVFFDTYTLPLLVIDTEFDQILDEPKIPADLKVIDNGPGEINRPGDPPTDYDGLIGIELRGSTSQSIFEKKGYGFETRNADGSNNNVELLGMPKENDWILHGPYSDKTLIRNALAYGIAGDMMDYAPRFRFVEVIIDNDYLGVYLLLEKIKRDDNRLDIANLKPEDNEGDQLTGGYILKIDKNSADDKGFTSVYPPIPAQNGQTIDFWYHTPKPKFITEQQENYIQDFIGDFERKLKGNNFRDPESGYRNYIDFPSFVDFFLVNELTKNPDAYRISTFLHKDRDSLGGKLKMGPVWDFNLGFGNVNYCTGPRTDGWVIDFNSICPQDFWLTPFWWKRLMQDTFFTQKVEARWLELRSDLLSDEKVCQRIVDYTQEIGTASYRNFLRWPVQGQYVWPNGWVEDTYDQEVERTKEWLLDRLDRMDGAIKILAEVPYDPSDYFKAKVYPNPSNQTVYFQYYVPASRDVFIRVFDTHGRLVWETESKEHPSGENILSTDIFTWPKGNYFYGIWFGSDLEASGIINHP